MRLHIFVNLSAHLHPAERLFDFHVNRPGSSERISVKFDLIEFYEEKLFSRFQFWCKSDKNNGTIYMETYSVGICV